MKNLGYGQGETNYKIFFFKKSFLGLLATFEAR